MDAVLCANKERPNMAVAEHATPALQACFRKCRLEEENRFMGCLQGGLYRRESA
jgi:hypothetical protein